MTRPPLVLAAALALFAAAPVGQAEPAAVIGIPGPPQPSPTAPQLPASSKAGWSCGRERCSYVKVGGAAWSDCFTSWAPSHRAWRPNRYCH